MFSKLLNIFRIPELRNKLLFTVALLCVYRIGYYVPLPGINAPELAKNHGQNSSAFDMVANYMSTFSGGDLTQGTIFGLGIMPYISASIILQLLGTVLPVLEKLRKEGEPGVRKINEWTRYLTVIVCVFQAVMYVSHFNNVEYQRSTNSIYGFIWNNGHVFQFMVLSVACLTVGSVFLMWLGEQIEAFGIGNGVSLIITAGIISRMPLAIRDISGKFSIGGDHDKPLSLPVVLFLIACFVFVVGAAIFLTQAQRRISIQQAKHMRGRRVYGGSKQYLPLRVNHAGVMPIIFASTLLQLPLMAMRWLHDNYATSGSWFAKSLDSITGIFQSGGYPNEVLFCAMIFFFSYFWNTVQFQPKEMANQLRDYGSFIPGLRPGKRTADYLENVMARITYVGAAFLCVIAIIPSFVANSLLSGLSDPNMAYQITQFLGGTGLLIVISVMLDFVNRIEANLVMRNYGGFMDESGDNSSKIKRARGGSARGPSAPQPSDPRGAPA